jgi:hypothetical protein
MWLGVAPGGGKAIEGALTWCLSGIVMRPMGLGLHRRRSVCISPGFCFRRTLLSRLSVCIDMSQTSPGSRILLSTTFAGAFEFEYNY